MTRTLILLSTLLLVRFVALPVAAAPGAETAQQKTPGYMTADETERYLTEKFQLDSPSRRYNKDAPVFLKTWTEEEKAAQRKAYLEAKAGLDRAIAEKAAEFTFPPGVYRYPGTGVTMEGATNLTIHAAGCEFISEPVNERFDGFLFSRCDNVTLKGPLVLDSAEMPYFQGTVLSYSKPGDGAVEIRLQPMKGYKLQHRHMDGYKSPAGVFDPETGAQVHRGQWREFKGEYNPDGTVTVRGPKWGPNSESVAVGRIFALSGLASNCGAAFAFQECRNMTIDGMDSFAAANFFGFGIEGRFTVRNFRLIPRPGTSRLVTTGVGQFNYACDMTVEDSEFGVAWDDGINYMGKMGMLYRQASPNQVYSGKDFTPGSTLRFFTFDECAPLGSVDVAACKPIQDAKIKADMAENFKAFLDARNRKGFWNRFPSLITFTKDFAVPNNALVDEIRHDAPCTITVRRTVWLDQGAQAILIRGVKRGTIENNLFIGNAGSAINVAFDSSWGEGPIPNHVAIRGNVIRANPRHGEGRVGACIHIGAGIADASKNNALMSGMVIEDNKIVEPTAGGIFLGNVDGGTIRNKVIDFSGSKPPTLPQHYNAGAIVVNACRNVAAENNRITCTRAFPNEILLLGNYDKDSVVLKNNTIVSAPRPELPDKEKAQAFNPVWAFYQPQGSMGWRFQFAPVGSQEIQDMPTPYWWVGKERELGKGYFSPNGNWGGVLQARTGSQFDPILAFVAPRNGKLRVDCDRIVNNGQVPSRMAILKNKENLWPREGFESIEPSASSSAHLDVEVAKGDRLFFRFNGGALFFRPIVTFAGPDHVNQQP